MGMDSHTYMLTQILAALTVHKGSFLLHGLVCISGSFYEVHRQLGRNKQCRYVHISTSSFLAPKGKYTPMKYMHECVQDFYKGVLGQILHAK